MSAFSADIAAQLGVALMATGMTKKRSANLLPKKTTVRSMRKSKSNLAPKSAQLSVPAVVHRYLTKEEMQKFESANLIGAALLFLESLIFETCSADKLTLAGYATVSKLRALGMSEEHAVGIMNRILSAAEKERKRNKLSQMF